MMNQRSTGRHLDSGRRLTRVVAAGTAAFVLAGGLLGFGAHQARAQTATPTTTAYVLDISGEVAVVNTGSGTVTDWITVPGATLIGLDPTGSHAYVTVTGTGGAGSVVVINTSTKAVSAPIPVGLYPRGIAVDPSDAYVYVANRDDSTVSVIDTSTNTVTATIPNVGSGPQNIAFDPSGTHAYVTTDDGLAVIDTATKAVTALIPDLKLFDVVVDPGGSHVYATAPASGAVSVIDTSTETVTATIAVPSPVGLALTPYGDKLYVTEGSSSGAVAVIDTTTNKVTLTIQDTALQSPYFTAMSANGAFAYVAQPNAANVAIIDATTNTVSGTVTDPGFVLPIDVVMNGHPQLSAPGAPTELKAKASKGSVTLTWIDHGQGITDHQVQAFVYTKASKKSGGPAYDAVTVEPLLTGSAAASYVYEGLAAGKTYAFKVAADNVVGTSDFSNYSNTVTVKP